MNYYIQEAISDPIVFKATTDLDTLHYHEIMVDADFETFANTIFS